MYNYFTTVDIKINIITYEINIFGYIQNKYIHYMYIYLHSKKK